MPPQSTYKSSCSRPRKRPENTVIFHSDSSGKERDSETGYHYFGARYYNSDLSIWLSVDPMSDKYPSLSPYNYCAWNPMKLVDPNGKEIDDYYNLKGELIKHTEEGSNKFLVLTKGKNVDDDLTLALPSPSTVKKMEGILNGRSKLEKGIAVEENGNSSSVVTGTKDHISKEQWAPAIKEIVSRGGSINFLAHLHPLDLDEMIVGSPDPSDMDRCEGNFYNSKIGVILYFEQNYDSNRSGMSINEKDYTPKISFYNSTSTESIYSMSFRSFKNIVSKAYKQ